MKKILILVALLLAPSVALAKQGSRNLDAETKLDKTCFVFPDFALTDNDPGSTGVLVAQALNSGPASYNITTVHAMPYAARVGVVINDANANDAALTCATVFVTGLTTDGTVKTEALGTIPETTPVYTTNVFLRVDRIRTGTCGDGTDATDFLLAFTSQYAWVGKKIRSDADVVSACSVTAANVMNCGDAATIATAVNPSNSTIDLLSSTFDGNPAADEEVVCITTLPGF